MALTNSNVYKGGQLMVFQNGATAAFATNHTLSISMETSSISSKDHGDFAATMPSSITWEVTCENLFSLTDASAFRDAILSMQPVTLALSQSNYAGYGTQQQAGGKIGEPGIVDSANGSAAWTEGTGFVAGKAYVTSFQVNAPAGDNATYSVTFTGTGALVTNANSSTYGQ